MSNTSHIPTAQRRTLVQRLALVVGLLVLAACGESPIAPQQSVDRVAAARVMPAVTDARLRVASGIENQAVRERMVHDLGELESALANGDGQKARFHVRVLGNVSMDYRAQQGATTRDGADVAAVMLALQAVSEAIQADFRMPLSP